MVMTESCCSSSSLLALIAVVEWDINIEDDEEEYGDDDAVSSTKSSAGRQLSQQQERQQPPTKTSTIRTKLRVPNKDLISSCGKVTYSDLYDHLLKQYYQNESKSLLRVPTRTKQAMGNNNDIELRIFVYDSKQHRDYIPLLRQSDDNIVQRFGFRLRLRVEVVNVARTSRRNTTTTATPQPQPLLQIQGRYYSHEITRDGRITVNEHELIIQQDLNSSNKKGTGTTIWDGAILLVRYLEQHNHTSSLVKNKNVLELGSGCGLVGIATAEALGAKSVVLSDLEYCRQLCELNIVQNNNNNNNNNSIRNSTSTTTTTTTTKCCCCPNNIEFCVIDWFEPLPERIRSSESKIDVILVADCVWMEELVEPLLSTLANLLRLHPNARIIMSYQRRGKATDDALWEGLRTRFQHVDIIEDIHPIEKPDVLHLLSIQ